MLDLSLLSGRQHCSSPSIYYSVMAMNSLNILIGLSGPSCSGKTTLARLLKSSFDVDIPGRSLNLKILPEDDFYKTDAE